MFSNDDWKRVQTKLNEKLVAKLLVDGVPGPKTKAALFNALAIKPDAGPTTIVKPAPTPVVPVPSGGPIYWKPHPFHPMFELPKPYTHLHPIDVLRSVAGQKEVSGSKDNPLIAHFHEHSHNLGTHSEGSDYHDEVPHCSSAQNWACDGGGCEKTDHALASSWNKYVGQKLRIGDIVPEGALVCLGGHITLANKAFKWTGKGSFEGFGSNQGNSIKTSTYDQSKIQSVHIHKPKPGTILAPIGILGHKPIPSSGGGNESTR